MSARLTHVSGSTDILVPVTKILLVPTQYRAVVLAVWMSFVIFLTVQNCKLLLLMCTC